jgi:hypothetical protein
MIKLIVFGLFLEKLRYSKNLGVISDHFIFSSFFFFIYLIFFPMLLIIPNFQVRHLICFFFSA